MRASADARGLLVASQFGAAAVDVLIPRNQEPDDTLDTDNVPARRTSDSAPPDVSRIVDDWNDTTSDTGPERPFDVRRFLVQVTGAAGELPEPREGVAGSLQFRLADEIIRHSEDWRNILRTWNAVGTGQDLDFAHPRWDAWVEGAAVATFDADGGRLRAGGRVRLDMHEPEPASRQLIEHAIRSAGAGRRPPLAYELLRDARAAWWRDQLRRSVIDAATAAELALTELAPVEPGERRPRTLGALIGAAEKSGVVSTDEADLLRKHVLGPRNDAVHRANEPTKWDAGTTAQVVQ